MSYTSFEHRFPPIAVQNVRSEDNPRVFMDISVDGGPAERIVIELFANVVPKTAENFRLLCTGERGKGKTTGKSLHYKGIVFNCIRKGFLAEGGAISEDPYCGESIYGGYFKDENYKLLHSEPGMLSVAHNGPNTNGSLFYIIFRPMPFFDGLNVVFGKVIKGMSTFYDMDELETPPGVVKIVDCGQIFEGKKKTSLNIASSSDGVKKHGDEREKQKKCLSSEGLLQISGGSEISEDKKDNLLESDQGKMKEYLKRTSSSDERVKEHSDDKEKRRKHSSSEGLLQILAGGEISENKRNNVMESDQDRGPLESLREHPRQQVGDDSIMGMLEELKQQSDWMMASIREIARAGDVHLPDYPLPCPQPGGRRQD